MSKVYSVDEIIPSLVPLNLHQPITPEHVSESFVELGPVDCGAASVGVWHGQTPWENHVGDEFLYILDGSVSLTLLRDDDAAHSYHLTAGQTFTVPAHVWHRSHAKDPVTMLAVLAAPHGPVSYAEDPRQDAR